jgi:hypothetical protein
VPVRRADGIREEGGAEGGEEVRQVITDIASAIVTVALVISLWLVMAAVGHAQTPVTSWTTSVIRAYPQTFCGKETKTATGYVRVSCPDYPAMKRLTGATMFPDEKGQQVWTRSSDPSVSAFRISMTYRKDGRLDTVVKYVDAHPTYESGAGWVLGDVEIVAVEVTELRESLKTAVQ